MVAIKTSDAESFATRPDPARPIVLVYGSDAGLVHERAERIVRASVPDINDPFGLVHLEGDLLSSEPARLAEEAHTVPLFGGKRAIWVKAGSRNFAAAVEALVKSPPVDCRVVIEAGDLRKSSPLRALCEKAKSAAAVACYPDRQEDLIRLVNDAMRAAKLTITPEARAALVSLIGGDRLASRSEIEKLVLYARDRGTVELDDVMAVTADASALGLDSLVDAAFSGRTGDTETHLARALNAGTSAGGIVGAALRHALQLHKARLAIDAGERPDQALYAFIPPLHFTRRPAVESVLKSWNAPRLERAIQQLATATIDMRRLRSPIDLLAEPIAQRALLSLAVSARRKD